MANQLRYDEQVVVVTGAGAGLGRQYAKFFASRGAKVVVNDLGGTFNGAGGGDSKAADIVVKEIVDEGGIAVPNYDSVEFGERIIDTAIERFGRIDVLINNAGILRDVSLKNMKDEDWDVIMKVHLTGTYKVPNPSIFIATPRSKGQYRASVRSTRLKAESVQCSRAAWPFFRKQKYGRVINTTSSSGLFGNFGQSNYAAAKMAVVGLTETLAKEGAKYNIVVNCLAPGAASRLTATVWPPEMMELMKPSWVVPLVAVLVHRSNSRENGSIFEAAAGHFSKIRWQRSEGLQLRPDETLTPGALLKHWSEIADFSWNAEAANNVANSMEQLHRGLALPANTPGEPIDFTGKVVLVTGAGEGLGRAYAHLFARLGAKLAVNDVAGAETVAKDIKARGADAIAIETSVEEGDKVVKAVVDKFKRIDIIVNNAGILRDKAFTNMSDDLWFPVINVHLRGIYKITKAAWPYMVKQKYGRIVNITSTSGIYGNFGQSNYAAAKCGIIGFSKSTAREGAKYNIFVNSLAPSAGTNMTRTVRPESEVQMLKPEYVAPLVAILCSDKAPDPTGNLYEAGSGWFAATRWQRARGVDFPHNAGVPSPEAVLRQFAQICDFDNGEADYPESPTDGSKHFMAHIGKAAGPSKQAKL